MAREVFVIREGKLVPKHEAAPLPAQGKAYHVMPDTAGFRSPVDGSWVEGKAARREHLKRNNVVEVGDMPLLNRGYCRNEAFARKHGLPFRRD